MFGLTRVINYVLDLVFYLLDGTANIVPYSADEINGVAKNGIIHAMKNAILIVLVFLSIVSMAQSRLLGGRRSYRPQLLEPLLPFSEAVEKAKVGNPQGWYALAIHYANGDEIDRDTVKARQFLQKASDMNYSNAVFVATMINERDYGGGVQCNPDFVVDVRGYTGVKFLSFRDLPLTNQTDIAAIRAGYERAVSLGTSAATNELARFERRVSLAREEAKKKADAEKRKAENAKLAEGL